MPKKGSKDAHWHWTPNGEGRDFKFNESLKSLEPLRDQVSVLTGLSHIKGRKMGGHDTADTFLTAAELKDGHLNNSVSADQIVANQIGEQTRYSSLVLSTDGGVGEPTRSSTLSFSRNGQPIPSLNQPKLVFERLFGVDPGSLQSQRQKLKNSESMLDLVLGHSKSLRTRLGKHDQAKFDEYLDSVRQIEKRVERSQDWLKIPKPEVDAAGLHLNADDNTPGELMKTMYDLIFLAFQTDSTRVATYQLGNMNGATSIAGKFPQLLGFANHQHKLAHGWNKAGGSEALGKWDQFRVQQFTYFLERLSNTADGENGTLLDNTSVLFGSSNSNTHNNSNYPLLLAGGSKMGFRHGQHHRLDKDIPLSNLLVTMLNRLDAQTDSFADSTGELTEVLS